MTITTEGFSDIPPIDFSRRIHAPFELMTAPQWAAEYTEAAMTDTLEQMEPRRHGKFIAVGGLVVIAPSYANHSDMYDHLVVQGPANPWAERLAEESEKVAAEGVRTLIDRVGLHTLLTDAGVVGLYGELGHPPRRFEVGDRSYYFGKAFTFEQRLKTVDVIRSEIKEAGFESTEVALGS